MKIVWGKLFGYDKGRFEEKKGVASMSEARQSMEKERYSMARLRHIKISRKSRAVKNMPPPAKR